jgi:putative hydrolase of the HAD superfamily
VPTVTATAAVVFDLDDTLYDYHEYARAGLRTAADRLAALTGERYHDELLAMYFQRGITDGTFDRLLARHDLPPGLSTLLVEAYHGATTPLEPYPDVESALSDLGQQFALGVVTDGRGGDGKLRRLGIRDQFDAVVVAPALDTSKRDPAVFELALDALGVAPSAATYVGDDPRYDVRVPAELGMTTVRVRRGRHAERVPVGPSSVPDHEVARLDELTALLEVATGGESVGRRRQ